MSLLITITVEHCQIIYDEAYEIIILLLALSSV